MRCCSICLSVFHTSTQWKSTKLLCKWWIAFINAWAVACTTLMLITPPYFRTPWRNLIGFSSLSRSNGGQPLGWDASFVTSIGWSFFAFSLIFHWYSVLKYFTVLSLRLENSVRNLWPFQHHSHWHTSLLMHIACQNILHIFLLFFSFLDRALDCEILNSSCDQIMFLSS